MVERGDCRSKRARVGEFAYGRWVSALLTLVILTYASRPAPAQLAANETMRFNIPAQPLETALEAYGAATRLQILYETSMAEGRRSAEVKGALSREAALHQLLIGTGLDFTYTEERAFTLIYARQVSTRSITDFDPFLGGVQTRILSVLCRNSETRPGAFRIALQLRIKPDGRIERPILLGSSGTSRRDASIADVLTNLAIDEVPPADMPQPITMVLHAGAPNGTDECPPEPRR